MAAFSDKRPEDPTKNRNGADASSTDAGANRTHLSDFASTALTSRQANAEVASRAATVTTQVAENIIGNAVVSKNTFVFTPATNGRISEAPSYDKPGNIIKDSYDASRKHPAVEAPAPPAPILEKPRFETRQSGDTPAETFKLSSQFGSGQTSSPDVVVRVPENFDPSKPIHMVVYNHGFYDSASSAYSHANLNDQMRDAPPNTVLVVPEWQSSPAAVNGNNGRFGEKDRFKNLVNDAFSHIPELKGKTLNNVDSIHIISHSAGYKGVEPELYRNGIENKVKSITMLDSMYNPTDLDPWLKDNIHALASGEKQFVNISNPGRKNTGAQSEAQAARVKGWLNEAHLGRGNFYEDWDQTGSVVGVDKFQKYSMVWKSSEVVTEGKGRHMSLPNLYVHRVVQADDF